MMAKMPYIYLARPRREPLTGTLTLEIIRDTDMVELVDGDEFVTISTVIDLFPKEPA